MTPPSFRAVRHLRPKFTRYRCIVVLVGIFCLPLITRAEKLKGLKPQGYVNDFAGVLNASTAQQISEICTEVDQKTQAQIAVVTIKTLEGLEASDFANQLYKKWGIGHKGDNRGVLILLATADHKYWTEVGYGLEPILPDGKVGGFGREMVPTLRAGDFNGALLHMTYQIAGVIAADRHVTLSNSEPPPPSNAPSESTSTSPGDLSRNQALLMVFFLILCLVLLYWAFKASITFLVACAMWLLGGSRRRRQGLAGIWWELLLASWLAGLSSGSSSGDWGSSGGFGGGSSSGGFSGFGGGSSGGGGAGGSW